MGGWFPLAWLTWDRDKGTVEGVYVNEEYRGKGIATELLNHAGTLHGSPLVDSGEYTREGYAWAKKRGLNPKMRKRVTKDQMSRMSVQLTHALWGGGRRTGDPLWTQTDDNETEGAGA